MKQLFPKILILFSFIQSVLPSVGFSQIYDWVPIYSNELKVITDPKIEVEFRLFLIRQSKKTIDLVTYDHRFDTSVGQPLLEALKEAAARGVKIRYAISWQPILINDLFGKVHSYLSKIANEYPNFQFVFVGQPFQWDKSWKVIDGIHEKLLVSDGKLALTSGRGHAEIYLHWLDTAFAIQGNLARQSSEAFNSLWKTLKNTNHSDLAPSEVDFETKVNPEKMIYKQPIMSAKVIMTQSPIALTPEQAHEVVSLMTWSQESNTSGHLMRGRILHHDMLEQLNTQRRNPSDYNSSERIDYIDDPIVNEVIRQLETAKSIKLTQFSLMLHPKLKKAIQHYLGHSLSLTLFTNSKATHLNVNSMRPIVGWYGGLKDLDDILQFNQAEGYILLSQREEDPKYLHRKLIIIEQNPISSEGQESRVIFGSHNLTFASSTTTDEMSFEIESNEFAQEMSLIFDSSIASFGEKINKLELHQDRLDTSLQQWISEKFRWLY